MKRCLIYYRVSTDAQERDGTSLETQEQACREYALAQGWSVTEHLHDTASGFTLDRPGLTRVRALTSAGQVDVVLTYALDRLSRKQTHVAILAEEMEERGVALDFVTEKFEDTATGQLLRSVKAFAAEFEREKISERTMRGKAERARSGRLPQGTGAGCYGYTYDQATGRREAEPFQTTVVRRIFERYAETRSFSAVSRELNEAGIPAMAGGRWYPLTIRRVLKNETYTGRTVYRRTKRVRSPSANGRRRSEVIERPLDEQIEVNGASPPLIEAAMWNGACRLSSTTRNESGGGVPTATTLWAAAPAVGSAPAQWSARRSRTRDASTATTAATTPTTPTPAANAQRVTYGPTHLRREPGPRSGRCSPRRRWCFTSSHARQTPTPTSKRPLASTPSSHYSRSAKHGSCACSATAKSPRTCFSPN